MAVGAIATAAGVGLNIYGQMKAAKDQRKAASAQADARRAQADEILARNEINIKALKQEVEQFEARQAAAFAGSGVDIGSGAPLVMMENTSRAANAEIENRRRVAGYQAEAALRGAAIADQTGRNIEKNAPLQAAGTGLSALGQFLAAKK